MAISAVVLNGTIQHQQNLSSLKQNADNKSSLDQSKISTYLNKYSQNKSDTVEISKEALMKQQQHDAKDNGKSSEDESTKKTQSRTSGASVRRGVSYEVEYTPEKLVMLKMPISRPMTSFDYRI